MFERINYSNFKPYYKKKKKQPNSGSMLLGEWSSEKPDKLLLRTAVDPSPAPGPAVNLW